MLKSFSFTQREKCSIMDVTVNNRKSQYIIFDYFNLQNTSFKLDMRVELRFL